MTENKNEKYHFQGTGLTTTEKNWAKKKFKTYRTHYHIENYSDLNLLEELCFREALQERTKSKIARINKSNNVKESNLVPNYIWDELDNNEEHILVLKDRLNLFKERREEDPFNYLEILKKKFELWREENQGSRTFPCPHCSEMIMLKIRTDIWETQKHSFFRDKILCNDHLVKLFKENIITKEDCAKILGVSNDYIDWLVSKWYKNDKKEN